MLQVVDASDDEAATDALGRARSDIDALDGGWRSAPNLNPGDRNGPTHVGAPVRLASGPAISIDGGYTPLDLLATIPSVIAGRLAEAGVADARITWPRRDENDDRWYALSDVPRAVVLHLSPVAPATLGPGARTRVPTAWLEAATTWWADNIRSGDDWRAIVGSVLERFALDGATALLERSRSAGSGRLVAGDPARRMFVVEGTFIGFQHLALAGGGAAASDNELLAIFDSLVPVAQGLAAELGHARLSIEPTFLWVGTAIGDQRSYDGWCPGELIDMLGDEITYDGAPYQILGPGHSRRLSDAGRQLGDVLRPVQEGRAELVIGEPSSWLLDAPARARVQAEARELLRPCLATHDEATELITLKWRRGRGEDG